MHPSVEFEAFYRTHRLKLLRYVERRIADQQTAEEVCAECFVIAWRKFDSARPFGLVWLYRTAYNLLGDAYRARSRERELFTQLCDQAYVRQEAAAGEMVLELLGELCESDREALRLTYWEGLSASEVGLVLGCSQEAAWKRISRAKSELRRMVETQAVGRSPRVG